MCIANHELLIASKIAVEYRRRRIQSQRVRSVDRKHLAHCLQRHEQAPRKPKWLGLGDSEIDIQY
jgi:predicted RNA-binding protein with EMAP domain